MQNKFRNEKRVKLGEVEILLRPTFENISAMESKLGGIAYLGWKYARAQKDPSTLPPLTECAQIIYFNQATPNEHSLEAVWDLVQIEGVRVIQPILEFLGAMTAGNKMMGELTEGQKKS